MRVPLCIYGGADGDWPNDVPMIMLIIIIIMMVEIKFGNSIAVSPSEGVQQQPQKPKHH